MRFVADERLFFRMNTFARAFCLSGSRWRVDYFFSMIARDCKLGRQMQLHTEELPVKDESFYVCSTRTICSPCHTNGCRK